MITIQGLKYGNYKNQMQLLRWYVVKFFFLIVYNFREECLQTNDSFIKSIESNPLEQ